MKASHWLFMAALLVPPVAQAAENDAPLDLIELLGEMDGEDIDLDIALADAKRGTDKNAEPHEEVKDDE